MNARRTMAVAALLLALGVAAGAVGSHALRGILTPPQLASYGTAVNYQLINALGLFLLGLAMRSEPAAALRWIALALLAGVICFSGSIYLMLAGAPRMFGYITPLGGVMLIAGWLALAIVLLTTASER
jgi:uncharacterized membrane protein YgdD (TMEM256/DUF423 family)